MSSSSSFLLLLALASSASVTEAATVTGRIAGHGGRPSPPVVVQIVDISNGVERVRAEADPDGAFEIAYDGAGLVAVRLSAPHHASLQVPVILEQGDRVSLEVRLGRYAFVDVASRDTLHVMGDFNDWMYELAVPLPRDPDGVFRRTFEVVDGTFAYQVLGVVPGRSVAGPMADRYVFDGSGDYRSVLDTDAGLIDLELDPADFASGSTEPDVEIDSGHAVSLRLMAPAAEMEARRDRFLWGLEASRRVPDPDIVMDPVREELALELPDVMDRARAEADAEVRAVRMLSALQTMRLATTESRDEAFVEEALESLPPESPYWALAPELIGYVATFRDAAAARELFEAVAGSHADPSIRRAALMMGCMHAYRASDLEMARALVSRMREDFPDATETGTAQKILAEMTRVLEPTLDAPAQEPADVPADSPGPDAPADPAAGSR